MIDAVSLDCRSYLGIPPRCQTRASSSAKRTSTAGSIAFTNGKKPWIVLILLTKQHMGTLEGAVYNHKKSLEEVEKELGESGQDFVVRAVRWWQESVLVRVQEMPARDLPYEILTVTHGGFIASLVRGLMQSQLMEAPGGLTSKWVCLNVSITTVAIRRDGKSVLEKYGDISHLLANEIVSVQVNVDELK